MYHSAGIGSTVQWRWQARGVFCDNGRVWAVFEQQSWRRFAVQGV